jgi:hypothetical protein
MRPVQYLLNDGVARGDHPVMGGNLGYDKLAKRTPTWRHDVPYRKVCQLPNAVEGEINRNGGLALKNAQPRRNPSRS